jgi:hypothetical protein
MAELQKQARWQRFHPWLGAHLGQERIVAALRLLSRSGVGFLAALDLGHYAGVAVGLTARGHDCDRGEQNLFDHL